MKITKFAPGTTGDWRTALAAGASAMAFAIAGSAMAQPDEIETIDPSTTVSDEDARDRVLVTGSRIRRNEFTMSAPVQIIDPTIGELRGTFDSASLIQSSSIAAGSPQITSAISSNFVTNGGAGAQTISLRGLGAERTLVLLNGRRAGPAGTRGAVNNFDLNVLPQSIIQSVEILKDGASSIYGSDAVAGVVNIITKRNYDGFRLDGFGSVPMDSGGGQYRAAATWGKEWSGGHFQMSLDYYRRNELARGQRGYLGCPEDYYFDQNGARADAVDPRDGSYHCQYLSWGHVWTYNYGAQAMFNPNTGAPMGSPVLIQYNYAGDNLQNHLLPFAPPPPGFEDIRIVTPSGFFPVNYDRTSYAMMNGYHPFVNADTVIPKTELFTFYLDSAVRLSDTVEVYAEILGNRRESYINSSRQFWQFGFGEDFCGFGFGDPLAVGWTGCILISPTAYTDHSDSSQRVDYLRALAGLRGEFSGRYFDGWQWDVYAQRSNNRGKYRNDVILQDAIDSQDFRTFPCAGTTLPVSGRPCLDINWTDPEFLRGNLTDAQRAFLFDTQQGRTIYTQTFVEGIMTGDVVTLPAGTLSMAFGAQWRRDEIEDTPGHLTLANNAWGQTGAGITAGKSETTEFFGEVDVPLVRDGPLMQSFTVQAAVRYTDVSTYGNDTTYKVGANWQVFDWLRFRGTYGTSFRAPGLFELFLADQTSFISQRNVDPCITWGTNLANGTISQRVADNCAADGVPPDHIGAGVSATVITGGGLGVLDAETSKAKTLSVILTPDGLFGDRTKVNLAVDYFDIEVNGEIAQLGAFNVVFGCYNSDFFPTDPLCGLFTRGQTAAPNNINTVRDSFVNVNSQRNKGIDFTMRAQHELGGGMGDIDLLAQFTLQLHDTIALFEGTEVSSNGEVGDPKWVGDVNFLWTKDSWTFFWGTQFVGPTDNTQRFVDRFTVVDTVNGMPCRNTALLGVICSVTTTDLVMYHSASLQKQFGERLRLTAGVSNIFDKNPPRLSAGVPTQGGVGRMGNSVFASQYDMVGRRIFVNARVDF